MSMPNSEATAYIDGLVPERREALEALRSLVLDVAPHALETMRYRMPTYELRNAVLCAFASQKQYMSLYVEVQILDRYRGAIEGLSLGQSCIRFRRLAELPIDIVRQIPTDTVTRLQADGISPNFTQPTRNTPVVAHHELD